MSSATDPRQPVPLDLGQAHIKVIGVGGGGVNAVRRMSSDDVPGVDLLCVNTDVASLRLASGVPTLAIGGQLTRGSGAGGDPDTGRQAAHESREQLRQHLEGADLVFIAAGLGGGTGTGAAPYIAAMAREVGALAVAIVTTPFAFEGSRRKSVAESGLRPLRTAADTVLVVSNNRLLAVAGRKTLASASFARGDKVMHDAIVAIARIINVPGDINVDLADIKVVLANGGNGVIGIGQGEGAQRLLKAVRSAIDNPLLEVSPHGARGLIFAVSGGPDLTLAELHEAGIYMAGVADPEAQTFFGMHIDEGAAPGGPVEAIVIATNLPPLQHEPEEEQQPLVSWVEKAAAKPSLDDDLPAFLRDLDLDFDLSSPKTKDGQG